MVQYDFGGKVTLVTGAARGQGRSHARYYAKHGADVVALDICADKESLPIELGTKDQLEETASIVENEGQHVLPVEADVSNESDVKHAVDEAIDEFGHIDILANNAAFTTFVDLVEMEEQAWDEVLNTGLKGAWLCSKHVGQHFVERGDGGTIVSTSSTAGLTGQPGIGQYVAAKHGIQGLTKTLALELAKYDVNVNAVAPTAVDTPAIELAMEVYGEEVFEPLAEFGGPINLFHPEDPAIESRDISEAYMWLSSDAARYVTGITLPVDAGFTAK